MKMHANEKRRLAIAKKLAMLFENRDWQKYPNASQQKFQNLMLNRASILLAVADSKQY